MPPSLWLVQSLAIAAAPIQAPPHKFTVATHNILYLNRDLPGLVAVIRESCADLVALQETNPESEEFLRRQLATAYPHMLFRGGKGSNGFGFLSRSPLRNLNYLEPLPSGRGTWIAEADLGGTNVQIASVHLASPKPRKMTSLLATITTFQEAEEIHAKEITRIHGKLSHRLPVIILGDFNSFSFFCAPKFLADHGFTDSFASVTANADQQGTWRYRSGEPGWKFRIDYIFHTQDLRTLESRILQSEASDHYPLVSILDWTPKPHQSGVAADVRRL